MTATAQPPEPSTQALPPADGVRPGRLTEALGWAALAGLLLAAGPLFVRMPLWPDAAFYDLCARHVLRGGALERDFLFLTPPAMVWARVLVRSALGWSSEALRVADLAVVGAVVGLLVAWLGRLGLPRAGRVWFAVLALGFYLTASEWVHCQPDTWMLLLALVALELRRRQLVRLEGGGAAGRVVAWGALEGTCWGLACLVKPFVAVPGLFVWLASAALMRRSGKGWWARCAGDAAGVLAGGLLMAAAWQGWLIASGSWHAYWHNNAAYRGEFYSAAAPLWARPLLLLLRLPPWGAVHLLAVPVALGALARGVGSAAPPGGRAGEATRPDTLLAAFYLGWLGQAAFMQSAFDYHFAPAALLALALVAGWVAGRRPRRGWAWVALGVAVVLAQPALRPARLALWGRCWAEGSSPELRDRLALDETYGVAGTGWRDLHEVELFLRERGVGDGGLLCYDAVATPLYLQLGVEPGTRFLLPSTYIDQLPGRRDAIRAELRASSPRYVVCDPRICAWVEARALGQVPSPEVTDPAALSPEVARLFPYCEPVVFRAGRYEVRQVGRTEPDPP